MRSDQFPKNQDAIRREDHPSQWNSVLPENSYIWPDFVGDGWWGKGFWVYHPQTSYIDIEIVDKGNMNVRYEGEDYLVPQGSMILIPPGESRLSTGNCGKCVKHYLGIKGKILANNLRNLGLDKVIILPDFHDDEFELTYHKLRQMIIEKKPDTVCDFCAETFKMLLLLSHYAAKGTYPEQLQKVLIMIDCSFSKQITLEDMCLHAQCRKSTLQSLFKTYLHSTPIKRLTEVRMRYASRLLLNEKSPIKEIAEKCGYKDQLYFSAVFRHFWGCSPREYRNRRPAEK